MFALAVTIVLGAAAVTHPVYPPQHARDDLDDLKNSVADALALSPRQLFDLVPAASGIFFCGCPKCDGGAQEHAMVWKLGMGDRVKCKHCGTQFPNDTFPHNRQKVIVAPSGATQIYRWHENDAGRQYFYEARAWYERWGWTRDRALRLANLHAHTADPEYGDRAAAILGRYAQVYPDYAIRFDHPFRPVRFWPADQKWPYEGIPPFRGAKFYWWGYGDIPVRLARAYDLLLGAGYSFDRMADLLGDDVAGRIEKDLIRLGYEFAAANPDSHGNMSPGLYANMIVAGRIIGAPDMVHEAVGRFRTLLEKQFFFDGWWRECAPSYHAQTVGNLRRVVDVARGYTDPPEWPPPRLENLDLAAEAPLLAKALRVLDEGCLPDGRLIPMNDTWWSGRRRPLDASVCRLWSGMAHAVLGAGAGAAQFQAHINWNAAFGHTHMDSAALILFAHGKELLSDIGYTHTRYRNWTINSGSHNLVVVDERSQRLTARSTGNLLFFDDRHPHVRVMDVDAQPAYPECAVYRRRLIHVHVAEGRDYLVDRFDVEGGQTRDYFLHGSADEESVLEVSVPLDQCIASLVPEWGGTAEHTGEDCTDIAGEKHHHYMFLWEVRAGDAAEACTATWRYGDAGLRSHLFPEAGSVLHRFRAPSVRRARDDDGKLKDYLMNGVMLRHTGGASRFCAVHVPFEDTPWVSAAYADGVFTATYDDVTDTLRLDGDRVRVASSAGWEYDSGEPMSGAVSAVERDDGAFAFHSEERVPDARLVRIDFGDKRQMVYRVRAVEGNRLLLADDPGFTYDPAAQEARFLYHPHEVLPGPLTWTVWPR